MARACPRPGPISSAKWAARCANTGRRLTTSILRVGELPAGGNRGVGSPPGLPTSLHGWTSSRKKLLTPSFRKITRFSRPINKNDGGQSTGYNFFLLRYVKVSFLSQSSHIDMYSLLTLFHLTCMYVCTMYLLHTYPHRMYIIPSKIRRKFIEKSSKNRCKIVEKSSKNRRKIVVKSS